MTGPPGPVAPWAAALPVADDARVLAAGADSRDLLALAALYGTVHVWRCEQTQLERAGQVARELEVPARFVPAPQQGSPRARFRAVAVRASGAGAATPEQVAGLVEEGGAAAWCGPARHVPRAPALRRAGWEQVRCSGLLPPDRGKVAVPLATGGLAQAGLSFHVPGKARNRAALRVASGVAALGLQGLLGRSRLATARMPGPAGADSYLLQWLGRLLESDIADAAVHVGEAKLGLLLLNGQGRALGVAKVGLTAGTEARLGRETEALGRLARTELGDRVPRILLVEQWAGRTVQVQSAVAGGRRGYQTGLTRDHIDFLRALSRVDRVEQPLDRWDLWPRLTSWAEGLPRTEAEAARAVAHALDSCRRVLGRTALPFHMTHGDFVPWNLIPTRTGLIVVDWDESEACGLPLYDLVDFKVRSARLLKEMRLPVRAILGGTAMPPGLEAAAGELSEATSLAATLSPDRLRALVHLCVIRGAMRWGLR